MSDAIRKIDHPRTLRRELEKAEGPVAAVFHAEWCPYCRRFMPTFAKLAEEYGDPIRFVSIDVDDAPDLEEAYDIGKIPTVLLLEDGEILERWVNEQDAETYRGRLESAVAEAR